MEVVMVGRIVGVLAAVLCLIVVYFLVWPVPIEPVAWSAPSDPGYTGKFERNERLKGLEFLPLGGLHGPEAIALDREGRIYATTHEGFIVRLKADGTSPEKWVDTKGRPLGIRFDTAGNLIVADGVRGLLSVSPNAEVMMLAASADGVPLGFTDDVDVAADGKIYFSDASTKFRPSECGGTMEASLLDIMEHGGRGRLLVYDPATGKATALLTGLNFANGVAVSHDQAYVLVNETGNYRVIRYWIAGPKKGTSEPLIENLPGFPDNISRGLDGRFWIAIISPRNKLVDGLCDKPFLRKVIQRMPKWARPKAAAYGHLVAVDGKGEVIASLQDANTRYPQNTSITETKDYLYIGSLVAPEIARLPKSLVGLR